MRRFAALVVLAAALAPAALAVAFGLSDLEAIRCAMACGHALHTAGSACCPVEGGAAAFKTCPTDESTRPQAAGLPTGVLMSPFRLDPPEGSRRLDAVLALATPSAVTRIPDHVPLSIS